MDKAVEKELKKTMVRLLVQRLEQEDSNYIKFRARLRERRDLAGDYDPFGEEPANLMDIDEEENQLAIAMSECKTYDEITNLIETSERDEVRRSIPVALQLLCLRVSYTRCTKGECICDAEGTCDIKGTKKLLWRMASKEENAPTSWPYKIVFCEKSKDLWDVARVLLIYCRRNGVDPSTCGAHVKMFGSLDFDGVIVYELEYKDLLQDTREIIQRAAIREGIRYADEQASLEDVKDAGYETGELLKDLCIGSGHAAMDSGAFLFRCTYGRNDDHARDVKIKYGELYFIRTVMSLIWAFLRYGGVPPMPDQTE